MILWRLKKRLIPLEWPLPGEFSYIITVRHPLDRIMSHYQHEKQSYNEKKKNLNMKTNAIDGAYGEDINFEDFVLNYIDKANYGTNWYINQLAGCDKSGCTETDLEYAKKRVKLFFSVVLISDNPEIYDLGSKLLVKKFGFFNADVNKQRAGTRRSSSALSTLKGNEKAMKKLIHLKALNHFKKVLNLMNISFIIFIFYLHWIQYGMINDYS